MFLCIYIDIYVLLNYVAHLDPLFMWDHSFILLGSQIAVVFMYIYIKYSQ